MKKNNLYRLKFSRLALLILSVLTIIGGSSATALAAGPPITGLETPTHLDETTPASGQRPASLNSVDIFAQVSPSIAFIQTPYGYGSGMLMSDGYVVTNAHVVWPFQEVRIVFPDGTEHTNAPVQNWDLLTDLAIIGPLQTSISPVVLADGEDLGIGSTVFLIGYPGEPEKFPQPTFTQGMISRLREWKTLDLTYFQTDALIAGGQSGGVLVSQAGEVIGISGFSFTEAGFGLAASVADLLPRIKHLTMAEEMVNFADLRIPLADGQREHDFALHNAWDRHLYVINEPSGTKIDVEIEGEQDAAFGVIDVFGNVVAFADDRSSGSEVGSIITRLDAPYFVVPFQFSESPGNFTLTSNVELIPYNDLDDGRSVTTGQTFQANIDYPFDFDYFVIDLVAGDTIDVIVDSILIDPVLIVDFPGAGEEEMITDDDSGGGVFGTNAKVTYRAPHTGSYFIVVTDAIGPGVGGYVLTVNEAPPDAVAVAPQQTSKPTIASPHGPMLVYESGQNPFTIQYPAHLIEQPAEVGHTASFTNGQNEGLIIAEEDMVAQGFGNTTLADYVDLFLSVIKDDLQDFQLISREQRLTVQGLPVEVVTFTGQAGFIKFSRFIYMHDDRLAFNATYVAPRARYDELEPLIDYSFDTFRVRASDQESMDAVFHFDQGVQLLASDEVETAIESFTNAIDLDPNLIEAYTSRSAAYRRLGNFTAALADLDEAIGLRPDDPDLYETRAYIHWVLLDNARALLDIEQALQFAPQSAGAYNLRALIYAAQENYEAALADVNKALELRPTSNAGLLDTRGYIYLKSGQYEKARADFEEIFSQGFEFPYALLGGGLTYAALGEPDKAGELLERGLLEAREINVADPQLVDLIKLAEQALSKSRST